MDSTLKRRRDSPCGDSRLPPSLRSPHGTSHTVNSGNIDQSGGTGFFGNNFGGNNVFNFSVAHPQLQQDETAAAARQNAAIDARRKATIDALKYDDQYLREEQLQDAFKGTCEWIFDQTGHHQPSFVKWLRGDSSFFCIYGKPGSGKSVLMKSLADSQSLRSHLQARTGTSNFLIAKHYFFLHGSPDQRSLLGFARNILHQLLSFEPECLDRLMTTDSIFYTSWSQKHIFGELRKAFNLFPQPVFLLTDALDEFQGDEAEHDTLFDFLRDVSSLEHVKVCVSSRPDAALRLAFSESDSFRIQDFTANDFQTTAIGRFQGTALRWDYYLQRYGRNAEDFISDLVQKADGVHLWLHLAVEELLRGIKRRDPLQLLRSRVSNMSGSLNELYKDLMCRADEAYGDLTARIISHALSKDTNSTIEFLGAVATLQPELFDDVLEYPLEDSSMPLDTVATCFNDLLHFSGMVTEYSAGFLEVVQAIPSRIESCHPQSIEDCICEGKPSRIGRSAYSALSRLVSHFKHYRISFIHRTSAEFLRTNEAARHFCLHVGGSNARAVDLSLCTKALQGHMLYDTRGCTHQVSSDAIKYDSNDLLMATLFNHVMQIIGKDCRAYKLYSTPSAYSQLLSSLMPRLRSIGQGPWWQIIQRHVKSCFGACLFGFWQSDPTRDDLRLFMQLMGSAETDAFEGYFIGFLLFESRDTFRGRGSKPTELSRIFLADRLAQGVSLITVAETLNWISDSNLRLRYFWSQDILSLYSAIEELQARREDAYHQMESFFLNSPLSVQHLSPIVCKGFRLYATPAFIHEFVFDEHWYPVTWSRRILRQRGAKPMCFAEWDKDFTPPYQSWSVEITESQSSTLKQVITFMMRLDNPHEHRLISPELPESYWDRAFGGRSSQSIKACVEKEFSYQNDVDATDGAGTAASTGNTSHLRKVIRSRREGEVTRLYLHGEPDK